MRRIHSSLILVALVAFVASQAGAAVSPPYTNDFTANIDGWSLTGEPSDFLDPTATWELDTAAGTLTGTALSADAVGKVCASALVEVDMAGADQFVVSANFRPQTFSYTSNTKFALVANSQYNYAWGEDVDPEACYSFDVGRDGDIRLYEFSPGAQNRLGQILTDGTTIMGGNTAVYLELVGVYVGGSLELTGTATFEKADGSGLFTQTMTITDDTPTLGSWFGVRQNPGGTSQNIEVIYDDFSVAVPEPASMTLIGAGLMGLIARRRRR